MSLETGSSAWYVAGARYIDSESIVSVQHVYVREILEYADVSKMYVIDLGGVIYAEEGKIFADHEEAQVEAIRLQKLKIENVKELLKLHIRWLDRLENP